MEAEKVLNTEVKFLTAHEILVAERLIRSRLEELQAARRERGIELSQGVRTRSGVHRSLGHKSSGDAAYNESRSKR